MAEVREQGFAAVFAAARRELGPGPWGISLDVDAVDPGAAPGVATPVPDGILAEELLVGLAGVLRERSCVGLEIVEFDPALDPRAPLPASSWPWLTPHPVPTPPHCGAGRRASAPATTPPCRWS